MTKLYDAVCRTKDSNWTTPKPQPQLGFIFGDLFLEIQRIQKFVNHPDEDCVTWWLFNGGDLSGVLFSFEKTANSEGSSDCKFYCVFFVFYCIFIVCSSMFMLFF